MKIYLGFPGWGWRMYGIGYRTRWFLGFSIQIKEEQATNGAAENGNGASDE